MTVGVVFVTRIGLLMTETKPYSNIKSRNSLFFLDRDSAFFMLVFKFFKIFLGTFDPLMSRVVFLQQLLLAFVESTRL